MKCICENVKNKINIIEVKSGQTTVIYHKNCPEHGLGLITEYPMIPYRKQQWFTKIQLQMLGRRWIEPKFIQQSPDGMRGLVESTFYRFMTEEEKKEYDLAN